MYTDYFGLSESPFTITPDPRYLFMSGRHQEALAHLLYGLKEGGGFVQLTGEVGTGKTTLTRAVLDQLPENVDVALIFNPRLTAFEFLAAACDELHVPYPRGTQSIKELIDALNAYLLTAHANGRRVVLIVDEAQNFQIEVLEQIRLLTNLETTKQKLLQIILVGQPELREMLARPELRQLAQRITARYHLVPMTLAETQAYIQHRLKVAGASIQPFTVGAMKRVWRFAGGVPRLVNILCDRALLGAYARDKKQITASMVNEAIAELGFEAPKKKLDPSRWTIGAAVAASLVLSTLAWFQSQSTVSVHDLAANAIEPAAALSAPATAPPGAPLSREPITSTETAAQSARAAEGSEPAPESASNDSALADAIAAAETEEPIQVDAALAQEFTAESLRQLVWNTPAAAELDQAFGYLFARWGLEYASLAGITGCERAIGARLHCHWASGSWQEFVQLNRPALIWFEHPDDGTKRYAIVHGMDGDGVQLRTGEHTVRVPESVMEQVWTGSFLVLWRPPALDVRLIKPGDRGELVIWLRRNLERLDGKQTANAHPEIFDRELKERVLAFQRARELNADGLVGEKTLIHLTSLTNSDDVPLLLTDD